MQPKGAKGSVTVYASGSPLLLHVAMSAYQTPQKIRPSLLKVSELHKFHPTRRNASSRLLTCPQVVCRS